MDKERKKESAQLIETYLRLIGSDPWGWMLLNGWTFLFRHSIELKTPVDQYAEDLKKRKGKGREGKGRSHRVGIMPSLGRRNAVK